MRIRNIKPEFWRSDDIAALPKLTRLTFIGLWSYVDDNGVGLDKTVNIAADLYANELADDPHATLLQVSDDLQALHRGGQILRYEADGKRLLYIVAWKKHQYIPKPSKGHMYPLPTAETVGAPDADMQQTCDSHVTVQVGTGGRGDRGTGDGGTGDGGTGGSKGDAPGTDLIPVETPEPPTKRSSAKPRKRLPEGWLPPPELIAEQKRQYPDIDLRAEFQLFTDHHTAKGSTMADWVAAWRTWVGNARKFARSGPYAPRRPGKAERWATFGDPPPGGQPALDW